MSAKAGQVRLTRPAAGGRAPTGAFPPRIGQQYARYVYLTTEQNRMADSRNSPPYAREATVHIETGETAATALDRALDKANFLQVR